MIVKVSQLMRLIMVTVLKEYLQSTNLVNLGLAIPQMKKRERTKMKT
jgi:hypothetical protein